MCTRMGCHIRKTNDAEAMNRVDITTIPTAYVLATRQVTVKTDAATEATLAAEAETTPKSSSSSSASSAVLQGERLPGLYSLPRSGETDCCNFQKFKERFDLVQNSSCKTLSKLNLFSHGWGVDLMVNTGNRLAHQVAVGGQPFDLTTVGGSWHYARDVCPRQTQNLECYFEKVAPVANQKPTSINCTKGVAEQKFTHCCDKPMTESVGYLYLTQPIQKYKILAAKRAEELRMPEGEGCATLHVRRSDSLLNFGWGGTGKALFRNVSVAEYLEVAQPYLESRNIKHILLMTDDQDAVYETASNTNYTWHMLKRKRWTGVEGGWENHFPSGKRDSEVIDILALLLGTAQCSITIGSGSRFSYMHYSNSKFYHKEPWMVFVNTFAARRRIGEDYHVNYNKPNAFPEKYGLDIPKNPKLK